MQLAHGDHRSGDSDLERVILGKTLLAHSAIEPVQVGQLLADFVADRGALVFGEIVGSHTATIRADAGGAMSDLCCPQKHGRLL
jgi:hypothetical protein